VVACAPFVDVCCSIALPLIPLPLSLAFDASPAGASAASTVEAPPSPMLVDVEILDATTIAVGGCVVDEELLLLTTPPPPDEGNARNALPDTGDC
jgi:hypothetical protein